LTAVQSVQVEAVLHDPVAAAQLAQQLPGQPVAQVHQLLAGVQGIVQR
jgi:hypothetical protein